jgi:hypothetical protein
MTMVYSTQIYWVSGLFPSSGILENRKHKVPETWSVSVLRWGGKTFTQLGPLERLRLAFSKGPNWVGISPLSWGRKQIQFPKRRVFYLEHRTM